VRINRADSRDGSVLGRVVSDDGFHTTSHPQAGRQIAKLTPCGRNNVLNLRPSRGT
jgi:hypothetical protein